MIEGELSQGNKTDLMYTELHKCDKLYWHNEEQKANEQLNRYTKALDKIQYAFL
jgi:hypothetical protein